MTQQTRFSMEIIAQQSSRMCSQQHLKESEHNSFELLIKAHDRIRTLQQENQELQIEIRKQKENGQIISRLEKQINRLNTIIMQKNLKIENLERINQKAIFDFVSLQRQFNLQKVHSPKHRPQTSIPLQLNSPLNLSKINPCRDQNMEKDKQRISFDHAKDFMVQQERLMLHRQEKNWNNMENFTFDKENNYRHKQSVKKDEKILKNCFSEAEVSNLITKVYNCSTKKQDSRDKLRMYHKYCKSIQKKHSPHHFQKYQTACYPKKSGGISFKYNFGGKSQNLSINQKNSDNKWAETAVSNCTSPFFENRKLFH